MSIFDILNGTAKRPSLYINFRTHLRTHSNVRAMVPQDELRKMRSQWKSLCFPYRYGLGMRNHRLIEGMCRNILFQWPDVKPEPGHNPMGFKINPLNIPMEPDDGFLEKMAELVKKGKAIPTVGLSGGDWYKHHRKIADAANGPPIMFIDSLGSKVVVDRDLVAGIGGHVDNVWGWDGNITPTGRRLSNQPEFQDIRGGKKRKFNPDSSLHFDVDFSNLEKRIMGMPLEKLADLSQDFPQRQGRIRRHNVGTIGHCDWAGQGLPLADRAPFKKKFPL